MAKRGKVLRDPNAGPGLMIVEGQQHPFFLEGFWQSEVPPKPGLAVEVEFDSQGKVSRITVVPEAQLATEQATRSMRGAVILRNYSQCIVDELQSAIRG